MRRMWSRSTRAPTGPSWLNCRARSTTSGCTRQCADLGLAIGHSLQAVAAAAGGAAQKTKRIQLRSADEWVDRHELPILACAAALAAPLTPPGLRGAAD